MRIIPHGNRVLVESRPVPNAAGIVLPQGVSGAVTHHVLDVGEGRMLDDGTFVKPPFKDGDEVVFLMGGASPLEPQLYGGKSLLLVAVEAIICKVERKTETDGMSSSARQIVRAGVLQ